VTFVFFASAISKSLFAKGLGCLLARAAYVNCDLEDIVGDGGDRGVYAGYDGNSRDDEVR
jgi:hypothetical protein